MLNSLKRQLLSDLRDLYHAEIIVGPFLAELCSAAQIPDMKTFMGSFQKDNQEFLEDIVAIFSILREDPYGHSCYATEGMIKEGRELLAELTSASIKDITVVSCCRRLLSYQLAVLGCAYSAAKTIKLKNVEDILDIRISRYETMIQALNQLAEGGIFTRGLYKQALQHS